MPHGAADDRCSGFEFRIAHYSAQAGTKCIQQLLQSQFVADRYSLILIPGIRPGVIRAQLTLEKLTARGHDQTPRHHFIESHAMLLLTAQFAVGLGIPSHCYGDADHRS